MRKVLKILVHIIVSLTLLGFGMLLTGLCGYSPVIPSVSVFDQMVMTIAYCVIGLVGSASLIAVCVAHGYVVVFGEKVARGIHEKIQRKWR